MNDKSLYFFNNQYNDVIISDAIHEYKNKLYHRSLDTQGSVANFNSLSIPFNQFRIRGEINSRYKLPNKAYSYIVDKNIIPYYNKKDFINKYGYRRAVSLSEICQDNQIFNQRIICNIDDVFPMDLYLIQLPSDDCIIYFHNWKAENVTKWFGGYNLKLSFENQSDNYYVYKNKVDLFIGNRIPLSKFTKKLLLPKVTKANAWKMMLGDSRSLLVADCRVVEIDGVSYFEVASEFVNSIPPANMSCYVFNDYRKTGVVSFAKANDNAAIFQLPNIKNSIPKENIRIFKTNPSTGRILTSVDVYVDILYPNVYDFTETELIDDFTYIIEWHEADEVYTGSMFDNNIKDYLLYKGDSYSEEMINRVLPEDLLNYKPIDDFSFDFSDYIDSEHYRDIRQYKLSKIKELMGDNDLRYNSLFKKFNARNKRYIHLSTNANLSPWIMDRDLIDNSVHITSENDFKMFNEPHTYIEFSNSDNVDRPTQVFIDGKRFIPTHIYTTRFITYIYLPKSVINATTEIVVDMILSPLSAAVGKKTTSIIFTNQDKPTDFPVYPYVGPIGSRDVVFFNPLTMEYIPNDLFEFGMFVDNYYLTHEDKEVEFTFGKDDRSYLITLLDEFYKTKNLEKVLLSRDTTYIPSPDYGFYKKIKPELLSLTLKSVAFSNSEISITNATNYRWSQLTDASSGKVITISKFREDPSPDRIRVYYGGILLDDSLYEFIPPNRYNGTLSIRLLSLPPSVDKTVIVEYIPYIEKTIYNGPVTPELIRGGILIDLSSFTDKPIDLDFAKFYLNGERVANYRIRQMNALDVFMIDGLSSNMTLRVDIVQDDPEPYNYRENKPNSLVNNLIKKDSGFARYLTTDDIIVTKLSDHGFTNLKYINGTYFVLGKSGHLGTSKDGERWKFVSVGSSSDLQNIVYGNGRYVLVGDNGLILHSSDLEVWERQLSISISSNLLDVIYIKDKFYIAGSPNTLLTSLDGITWSSSTLSNELNINRISYYKDKFKLTGDTKLIAVSNDGVDWVVSSLPSKANYIAHNSEEMIWGGENSSIGKYVDKTGYIIKPEDVINDIHIHSANYSHGLFILGSVNKIYIVLENNLFKLSNNDADYYSIDIPNHTIIGALVIDNILVALDTEGYMLQIPLYYT